ncbi:phosphoribosylaminoimidazole carboxylase ade2 [Coemansia sp. RSA 989]|nr:phosphoribosylaminoimidazole carboxylase [Coemansia mojavensis]KAJ1738791.1 phosphoribosylaminoimidazole carboxylase ade2 [Coemansia sp. RSA 1086]KAJ1750332.1 phosphoribosylaminoimidazole carboxylase ade2 [Coemansia sp. RSA 1821]KAJ1864915.1 phosphoribosylaminoimidazole carboxylase ade2 [Coemansia sp. RSA 989]KAJ1873201.1 phosphoribosylaminoimidazole carboxylase ade2 [Coemansia sp. RSA 990]KAJ2672250.1 phosphoribosylaminoimidazole carboxylase ade2 [Coemansia sp. RSA 1085]
MDKQVIGILGGGQLGRMLVEAANRMNVQVRVLDPTLKSPAKQISNFTPHKDQPFTSSDAIQELAQECDVLTVEIEHVNCDELATVEKSGIVKVRPSADTIRLIQDKYLQKEYLAKQGLMLPEYTKCDTLDEAKEAGQKFGYPFVLKCRLGAYDGRGNYVVKSQDDIETGFKRLGEKMLYAEKFVPFTKELAVMVVRRPSGQVATYPVVETVQRDNICELVYAPAQIDGQVREVSMKVATDTVSCLPVGSSGIFGVEMFLHEDGQTVLVNEIAPRPHNSGHYTIEACSTSQFENHIRAVLDLPLGDTSLKVPAAAMINVLGGANGFSSVLDPCLASLDVPGSTVHLYGKADAKVGRKMGHITVVADSALQLSRRTDLIVGKLANASDDERSRLNYRQSAKPRTNGSVCDEEKRDVAAMSPLVGIIMGSDSDLPTMRPAARLLEQFGVPFELTIVSAHRTPDRMFEYARAAHKRGLKAIIAGAGGAAHLPGMVAALTPLPVIGVPVKGRCLDGVDSLHSIVQMPRGVPVATVAINNSDNAALLAVRIIGASCPTYLDAMAQYMDDMRVGVEKKIERLDVSGWKDYEIPPSK